MNKVFMVDQAPRHEGNDKLAKAKQYLADRRISVVSPTSELVYTPSEKGSRILRHLRKRAK